MNDIIPDIVWYTEVSKKCKVTPRCPFAFLELCPQYFRSYDVLRTIDHQFDIEEDKYKRLDAKWTEYNQLTNDEMQMAHGSCNSYIVNFCPEITYNAYGYFASYLGKYADHIDEEQNIKILKRKGVIDNHPGFKSWGFIKEKHFTECSFYSLIKTRNL
ncbi:MAG: hypothetical protein HGA59_01535 [Chlorobiaceae bacterium]|jgi:hypothetical protein|nr:hypothetical protein [Chlorobiaceae bacterium]